MKAARIGQLGWYAIAVLTTASPVYAQAIDRA